MVSQTQMFESAIHSVPYRLVKFESLLLQFYVWSFGKSQKLNRASFLYANYTLFIRKSRIQVYALVAFSLFVQH